jgi:hypothetical protein
MATFGVFDEVTYDVASQYVARHTGNVTDDTPASMTYRDDMRISFPLANTSQDYYDHIKYDSAHQYIARHARAAAAAAAAARRNITGGRMRNCGRRRNTRGRIKHRGRKSSKRMRRTYRRRR